MKKLSHYKGQKIAVNCTTPEQDESFRKLMHENGLKWVSGESYLEENVWRGLKENTCYAINEGKFCTIAFYQSEGYTILPATDFLEEEFVYGQEYEFSDDNDFLISKKLIFVGKIENEDFIGRDKISKKLFRAKYCRKINTERNEAITTAKELITKFDIKQEELFNN